MLFSLLSAASLFEDGNNKLGVNNSNSTNTSNSNSTMSTTVNAPKKNRRKPANTTASKRKQQQQQQQQQQQYVKPEERSVLSDNESTVSAEDEQLVPVGPMSSSRNLSKPSFDESPEKFTFSTLMRQMARKYQQKDENDDK